MANATSFQKRESFIPGAVSTGTANILKYNAKARLWGIDGTSLDRIRFIPDLENAQAGWLKFAEGSAPDFRLVPVKALLDGAPFPAMPTERSPDGRPLYRRGFRLMVKLPDKLAGGAGTVREFAANSMATCSAIDDLLREWFGHPKRAAGKLPVVSVKGYREIPAKTGSNFAPLFVIDRVIDAPPDLVEESAPASAAAADDLGEDEPEDFDADEVLDDSDDLLDDLPAA
jgi:hypothetical protein